MAKWVKGESGNYRGRPKIENCLTDKLRALLTEHADEIANMLMNAVLSGQVVFGGNDEPMRLGTKLWLELVRYVADRCDGTPKQAVEIDDVNAVLRPIIMLPEKESEEIEGNSTGCGISI